MPRQNRGARLVPIRKKAMRRAIWYIRWYDRGEKRERSTGMERRVDAEKHLVKFIQSQAPRPSGARDPDEVTVATVLSIYGNEHAPHVADPVRIANCIAALLPFWGDRLASAIKAETCRRYAKDRGRADGTTRRELGCLSAAGGYCVKEGYLTAFPPVWSPPVAPPKSRWLTRGEAAALLWEARREPQTRFYLPLYIIISLYTGARTQAVLSLRWTQSTTGGWVDLERERIDFSPMGRSQTKKRRSVVPIPRRLMTFLLLARRRATSDYVVAFDGKRLGSIKKGFATALRRAGLDDVTPHTLRHTAITWQVQKGVPLWEVGGFVGASQETIERVYGHHGPDYLERARRALD